MTRKWDPPDPDHLVQLYESGESIRKLAVRFSVSQSTIKNALDRLGVQRRDRSAAGLIRAAREPEEARRVRLRKLGLASTGRRKTPAEQRQRALMVQERHLCVGEGEQLLIERLRQQGLNPVWQLAVGHYNVDIGLLPIAIEVHRNAHHPLASEAGRQVQRVKDLADLGCRVLYVWIRPHDVIDEEAVTNEVVAFLEETRRNPALIGEHRVIRGNGELAIRRAGMAKPSGRPRKPKLD